MQMARDGSSFSWSCYKPGHLACKSCYSEGLKFEVFAILDRLRESRAFCGDTSAKPVCCGICHQFEKMNISYALDGSFWCKSSAVGTAQPTPPCYFSQVLAPGKSCHHPFFFFVFPGVVDHDCLTPRALYPRQSTALWGYQGCFLCLWSSFLSLFTGIEEK